MTNFIAQFLVPDGILKSLLFLQKWVHCQLCPLEGRKVLLAVTGVSDGVGLQVPSFGEVPPRCLQPGLLISSCSPRSLLRARLVQSFPPGAAGFLLIFQGLPEAGQAESRSLAKHSSSNLLVHHLKSSSNDPG